MFYLLPQTHFGPQFKHAKRVDIFMGDIESLSTYPHYWKSCLVPHLLIGNIYHPDQIEQGWNLHQAGFFHSDLRGSTNGEQSLLLLTPPTMILNPYPYAEKPKQPWNPMLTSVNPVTSEATKIQLTKSDKTEARVYGSKSEVWPYILFSAGHMGLKVRENCVYNYPPFIIRQLTINELATLWDVPMLTQ